MNVVAPAHPRHDQRGKAVVWILVALLVLGGAFAVYWFVIRKSGGGGASAQLATSVIPADADMIGGADLGALLASPQVADLMKKSGTNMDEVKAKLSEAGVKPEDLQSLVIAADVPDAGDPQMIFAVKMNGDTKAAQGAAVALKAMLPPNIGDKVDLSHVEAFDGGLVMAGSGPFYDEAAKQARGQGASGKLAQPLLDVRDAVDTGAQVWFAMALPKGTTDELPRQAKMLLGGGKPTHAAFSVSFGSSIEVKGALLLEGADPGKVASQLDSMMGMASMALTGERAIIGDIIKNLKIGSSGQALTFSLSLTEEQAKALQDKGGMF